MDTREVLSSRWKWARLFYLIADNIPALIALHRHKAVKEIIRETGRYFENQDEIGNQVCELLKAHLRQLLAQGSRVLPIGHSLGSTSAYAVL